MQMGEAKMCMFKLRAGLTILLLSWATPGLPQVLSPAERPNVKIGDSTVFRDLNVRTGEKRDTSFVIIRIDPDKIVSETSGSTSGTRTFTRDFNPVEIKTGESVASRFKPFWPYLQFPLQVGREWAIPFEVEASARPANRNAKWQWKARVVAAEAVTVPAGTFQAFKIEYDGSFATRQGNKSWTGTSKEVAWFAPELNRIVKHDFEQSVPSRHLLEHHVIELLSLKPAP
jgi:hypothetical protein